MSSTSVLQTITAPTTTTVIRYNSKEFKENGSKADLANDFRLWMDMVNPSSEELLSIQKEFNLDINTINLVKQKTKRPQLRILEEHLFSIILDIRYKTLDQLIVDGIYMFVGKDWLITIHSSDINLVGPIKHTFEQKNQKLKELGIDALFYTIINEVIGKYEQLLTSIEITVTDFEQKSLFRNTSKYLLDYLDTIVRQIILIRRHLWYTRAILNLLIHTQEDKNNKDKTKFLHIAYDDINHLIDLLESYRDTINSTRDMYIANVSLQLSDTMRVLTVFSVILMPLTLIVGIYGMNGLDLSHITSLPSGLLTVVLTMVVIILLLLVFFKRKQWIFIKEEEHDNSKNQNNR